ncbi:carbon-nitrogen hydrolase family protein [Ornithinibacillus sp. L9]|uniref:Carbon-nitrogen hydrolase family protein n=1 Tax=Ornithinibacillus caprae TaxID=2678566 RepID=A0A6N8FJI0_9BACI|nr:carbon-nitrogen hydrolase family protein [Ornithinibacillus caprae]MUK87498.1 carbon-nitrogen hydrolase family protein [Ornithinibacillus caprae]
MRVTIGQFDPVLGDKAENIVRMIRIMEQASEASADIVIFPELSLTGYFIQDVDAKLAEPINGVSIQSIQEKSRSLRLHTILPWPELAEDGSVYNSACLISDMGEMIGTYRKVHLYETEKEVFTAGNEFNVFETKIGRIGLMICFDLDFPESTRILNLKGADIVLSPTNNMVPYQRYHEAYVRSRSMENELPIVSCNRIGNERDLTFFGESTAYDAYGNQLIKLDSKETIQTAEIPINQQRDPNLQYKENRIPKIYEQLTNLQ